MIPSNFEYHAPKSIEAALDLINQYGDDCKILSGGHSLIPVLKLRLAAPAAVIDIGRIPGLSSISLDRDRLRIGALATHASIAASDMLGQLCPLLATTAHQIGDPQVRNRGTLGGSLVHADPAADWPAAILALDASITVRGSAGERHIAANDFFVDMLTSAVQQGEIVTEISVAVPAQPRASSYIKVAQSASGFAVVGVAVQLEIDNGVCVGARIGVTGFAPKPYRASSTENALKGNPITEDLISSAAALADSEAADAMNDIHASGEYRRHLTRVIAARALRAAARV
ncbi:MAG: xanthine dehydrogenase family protein subunit M [Blastocatellales bacterium]|nr:xanthine dehydrogenase family protein subunit M [Blastocatellales bacterium]